MKDACCVMVMGCIYGKQIGSKIDPNIKGVFL